MHVSVREREELNKQFPFVTKKFLLKIVLESDGQPIGVQWAPPSKLGNLVVVLEPSVMGPVLQC